MIDEPYYRITARANSTADVHIYGEIGESFFEESVTAKGFVAEIGKLQNHALTVYINSPGGSVMDATAMYNALKRHPQPVHCIVDGWALSAASLIAMAGQSVSMGQGALLMLHNPSTYGGGNSEDLRKAAETLDTVRAQMLEVYTAKTGADIQTVSEWLDKETWFDGPAAIQSKLADRIVTTEQPSKHAPPVKAQGFNLPLAYAHYLNPKEPSMTQQSVEVIEAVNQPAVEAHVDVADITARAVEAERQRQNDIRANFNVWKGKMPSQAKALTTLEDQVLASGTSVAVAKERLLTLLGELSGEPIQASGGQTTTVADQRDRFREGAAEALLMRAGMVKNDSKNEFRAFRLSALAQECLARAQENPRGFGSEMTLIKAAITHTSSDFPVILENVLNKTLQESYDAAADTWKKWCTTGSVSDFRPYKRLRLGSFGNLDPLSEAGEYRHKAIPDATAETVSISTKANTITLSRQAIINDDLGAFVRLGQMLARSAARSIEADAYALLTSNPVLDGDNTTLFNTTHGNLANGAAAAVISVASLDAARTMIKMQKDRKGNEYLAIQEPFIMLCPVSKAGAARVANESEYDPEVANKLQRVNITRGILREIVDTPYLSGNAWYLFADPNQYPTFEVLFLNGQQSPYTEQREHTNVDGVSWLIRLDYGVNVVDYVGAFRNDGA